MRDDYYIKACVKLGRIYTNLDKIIVMNFQHREYLIAFERRHSTSLRSSKQSELAV
jgi:hypothetical protein